MIRTLRGLIACLVCSVLVVGSAGSDRLAHAENQPAVVVTLRPQAEVHHTTVCLGDIAEVESTNQALVKKLKSVDLTVLSKPGDVEAIQSRLVRVRLLLEGIDRNSLQVTGADEVQVSLATRTMVKEETNTVDYQEDVIHQAVTALARSWICAPEDIQVQVLSSQTGMVSKADSLAIPELELPSRLEPGRVQARLRWTRNGRIERIEQITLDVRLRQSVVLVSNSITRGEPLTLANVTEDRRLLPNRVEQLTAEQVVGLIAKRGLSPGDVVNTRDLVAQRRAVAQINAREGVRVVAKKGPLTVVLPIAEALQSGRVGEVIRVRNLQSGQIIQGRVVSSQEVEIVLQ